MVFSNTSLSGFGTDGGPQRPVPRVTPNALAPLLIVIADYFFERPELLLKPLAVDRHRSQLGAGLHSSEAWFTPQQSSLAKTCASRELHKQLFVVGVLITYYICGTRDDDVERVTLITLIEFGLV